MPSIRIEAIDTLFFRDGRPFSMGEETFATGIFPPPPSVLYGALRSAYASENGISLDNIRTETEKIKINGINYACGNFFYPMPLDLVVLKSDKEKARLLYAGDKNNIKSNSNDAFKYVLWHPEHIDNSTSNCMISADTFEDYLFDCHSHSAGWNYKPMSKLITTEVKIGIGRTNETKQSEDGKLYRVGMQRMQSLTSKDINERFSFVLNISENSLTKLGKLGAEGKSIVIRNDEEFTGNLNIQYEENSYFKLYLQTTSLFEKGYLPDLKKHFKGWDLEILTCAIGRPQHIGGWDLENNFPKSMMKAIPAGSVYYVKVNNGTTKQFAQSLNENPVFSISDFRQEEGFGLFQIGNLNFENYKKSII